MRQPKLAVCLHALLFTMQEFLPHSRPRGKTHPFAPVDLSTDWQVGGIIKARAFRVAAHAGHEACSNGVYTVERCVGSIELTGNKAGQTHTSLLIGFSLATDLPAPSFSIASREAIGTLTLPAHLFGAFLAIVHASPLYFRMGGDGYCNAIANDATFLT